MRTICLVFLSLILAAEGQPATSAREAESEATDRVATTRNVAIQTMRRLRAAASVGQFHELGFDSPQQAASAQIGVGLPVYFVRLDDLREYNDAINPATLLTDAEEIVYLLYVEQQPVTTVTLMQNEAGQWEPVSFGAPEFAKSFGPVRELLSSPTPFLVEIPALGMTFLGRRNGEDVMLTALEAEPSLEITARTSYNARGLFLRLVELAREHNGEPY